VAPEDRPYRPHVTLARVKEPAGLRTAPLLEGVREHEFGVRRVDAITLFESRLSPRGPTYMPLHRTPLAGRE
jgi:2'-5' RNA ligase